MEETAIRDKVLCEACNENTSIHFCPAINKKICIRCCDDYQVSDQDVDDCLSCELLCRDISYNLDYNNYICAQYKDKYVFDKYVSDSTIENWNLKSIELYKRLAIKNTMDIYDLAFRYHESNMNEEALVELNSIVNIIEDKKDKKKVYELYGTVYHFLGEIEKSRDAYVKSMDYGNNSSYMNRQIGVIYKSFGNYPQAIFYHERALKVYFEYKWLKEDDQVKNDYLYFTNYYSLAFLYLEIEDYKNSISSGQEFINYYGGYDKMMEIYDMYKEDNIEEGKGSTFMPSLISDVYEIMALSFKELGEYEKAKENINIARIFDPSDVVMAKFEGFLEGKLDNFDEGSIKENIKTKNENNINLIINNGSIENVAMGDGASINIDSNMAEEVKTLLSEIKDALCEDEVNTEINDKINDKINDIIPNIDDDNCDSLKSKLTKLLNDLLTGVTSGLIANSLMNLLIRLSTKMSKL